jgi:hypothetical protein
MAFYQFSLQKDGKAPTRRECHTICVSGDSLLLFGGNDDAGRFQEVHILDTLSMRWEKVAASGSAPGHRSAHTAIMDMQERYMYVFGGWNGTDELGDVHRFDVQARLWEKVATTGPPPYPRHFHMAARVGNKMCV